MTRMWTNDPDIACAVYWYCANYHGGQGSKRYSILSTIPYAPGMLEDGPDDIALEYYRELQRREAFDG